MARILVGPDDWRRLLLFVIDDFNDLRVSTFKLERGEWPPADHEIMIEQDFISAQCLLLGIAGLVIGIPAGIWAGREFAAFTARVLNFNIASYNIEPWVTLSRYSWGCL